MIAEISTISPIVVRVVAGPVSGKPETLPPPAAPGYPAMRTVGKGPATALIRAVTRK
jgi:hypothetical protein